MFHNEHIIDAKDWLLTVSKGEPISEMWNLIQEQMADFVGRSRMKGFCNCKILFEKGRTEPELRIFLEQEKKRKDLQDLLPSGYVFQMGEMKTEPGNPIKESFACLPFEKVVRVDPFDVDYDNTLPALLHEIGHAWQSPTLPAPETVTERILDIPALIGRYRRKFFSPELKGLTDFPHLAFRSRAYVDRFFEWQSKSENGAWQFSMEKMKQLQNEGWDVYSRFIFLGNFARIADSCLNTYDARRFYTLYIQGGRGALEQAEPLFLPEKNRYTLTEDESEVNS